MMTILKILLATFTLYSINQPLQRNILQDHAGFTNNNYPNAKVFIPYIYPSLQDKLRNWSYTAVGYIRSDANITSRRFNSLQIPNVISFFPRRKNPDVFNGDSNATPLLSFVDPIGHLGGLFTIQKNHHEIDIFIGGNFCGFIIGDGIMTLENTYLSYRYKKHELFFGQYINPMRFEYNAPRVVSYNFGAPFASRAFNPQIFYTYKHNKIGLSITAYTQFLYCSKGPVVKGDGLFNTAIPDYQQWSLLPAVNMKVLYDNECDFKGIIALDLKTIKPFIYIQPIDFIDPQEIPYINNNNISSFVISSFFKLQRGHTFISSQMMYGNNAMDFYTFGGYGIRFFEDVMPGQKTFKKTTYAPIYFISGWASFETTKIHNKFAPGIFIGYATNLNAKYPLQLNAYDIITSPPQPIAYSIDSYYADMASPDPIRPKSLKSLLRISPRLWVYCNRHLLIGTEVELSYARFGYVNRYGTATICPEKVPMVRSTISTQFSF